MILDACSRRVIALILTALRMALARRTVQLGLVHHSARCSQYSSSDYTDLLKADQIAVSMSRKAIRGTTRGASLS